MPPLPEEVLGHVFSTINSLDASMPSGLRLAAVGRQWRRLALKTPALWTTVVVTHDKQPDLLQELVLRSASLSLDVEIRLEAFRYRFDTAYTKQLDILVAEIHRWRSLAVYTTNPVLRTIRNHIQGVLMPLLQHLRVVQTDTGQVQHLGPFLFDPGVFCTLHLERTMIYAEDCTMLAGLSRVQLTESSLAMLDENKLLSLSQPTGSNDPREPSIIALEEIYIDGSNPTPDGLPYCPSFSSQHITTVSLSRLVAPSMDTVQALSRFYGAVLGSPVLQSVVIADIHGHALTMLFSVIRNTQFPKLRLLVLSEVDMTRASVDDGFLAAFAAGVEHLFLRDRELLEIRELSLRLIQRGAIWRSYQEDGEMKSFEYLLPSFMP
uniref:F-box domain-containing protein n=1 Tax=Mycena chlorophos TaxID=658473 RepID=A0ABQ0M2K1_MYCCL|nr:predicted protein [Mycena chlorophos]